MYWSAGDESDDESAEEEVAYESAGEEPSPDKPNDVQGAVLGDAEPEEMLQDDAPSATNAGAAQPAGAVATPPQDAGAELHMYEWKTVY